MLALLDETIPDAKTSSLCNPRNVKLSGTVQHLTSRPIKMTEKTLLQQFQYFFVNLYILVVWLPGPECAVVGMGIG